MLGLVHPRRRGARRHRRRRSASLGQWRWPRAPECGGDRGRAGPVRRRCNSADRRFSVADRQTRRLDWRAGEAPMKVTPLRLVLFAVLAAVAISVLGGSAIWRLGGPVRDLDING